MLAAIAQPLVLALASQIPYLKAVASLSAVQRCRRAPIGRRIATPQLRAADHGAPARRATSMRSWRVLAPLFEEHDPAHGGGALLAALSHQPSASQPARAGRNGFSSRVVEGFRDGRPTKIRASAKDLVGALIKEVGLLKGSDRENRCPREHFRSSTLRPDAADQAVRRLSRRSSIRGRRVTARPDRA